MKAARTAPTRSAQAADAGSGNAAGQVRPTAPMQFAAVPTTEDAFDVADHGEVRATTTQLSSQDLSQGRRLPCSAARRLCTAARRPAGEVRKRCGAVVNHRVTTWRAHVRAPNRSLDVSIWCWAGPVRKRKRETGMHWSGVAAIQAGKKKAPAICVALKDCHVSVTAM